MKKLYILEVIYFGAVSVITGLAPRFLIPLITKTEAGRYATICSWVVCVVFGLVALWFIVKGTRKYIGEKQRQRRLSY